MRKTAKKVNQRARPSAEPLRADELLFEIDRNELKRLISKRAAGRRALAVQYGEMLKALPAKPDAAGADDYKRERLERAVRRNEDYADFLVFACKHLAPSSGSSLMTGYDLKVLDLLPSAMVD